MNKDELKERLIREGIPETWFSVTGEWPPEGHVLSYDGREWRLKYVEKGTARELGRFPTEESACAAMHEEMLKAWAAELRGQDEEAVRETHRVGRR